MICSAEAGVTGAMLTVGTFAASTSRIGSATIRHPRIAPDRRLPRSVSSHSRRAQDIARTPHFGEVVVGADHAAAAGVVHHERKLVGARARVDRNEHGAGHRGGDHRLDELRVVAQGDHEAIPGLHAAREQPCGEAVGVGEQLRVGAHLVGRGAAVDAPVLESEHVELGFLFRAQRDQVGKDEFVALAHGGGSPFDQRMAIVMFITAVSLPSVPPPLWHRPTRAPSTWRAPARPCSCQVISASCATPVAPTG